MNFIPYNIPLVLIFIFVNSTLFCPVSPLSIKANQNENLKLTEFSKPRFGYNSEVRASLPISEAKESQDTLTLYKGESENLWRTDKGDTVRIIPLDKSELERLETPQFHEPSFLREDKDSHKLCKAKDARHHIPSHVEDESSAMEEETKREVALKQKIKGGSATGPLVKISRQSFRNMNENGRTFFGLFGPSRPPPPVYGPGPYYDPYYGPPDPYYGPPDPYYGPDPYYNSYYPW